MAELLRRIRFEVTGKVQGARRRGQALTRVDYVAAGPCRELPYLSPPLPLSPPLSFLASAGVNFRAATARKANELGLAGWVQNTLFSTVIGEAEGEQKRVDELYVGRSRRALACHTHLKTLSTGVLSQSSYHTPRF